jgi:hypothetical protein
MSTLKERLDRMREASAAQIPAEARAVMERAAAQLHASGIRDRVARPGQRLPEFALQDTTGATIRSGDVLARGPLVVTLYRGDW